MKQAREIERISERTRGSKGKYVSNVHEKRPFNEEKSRKKYLENWEDEKPHRRKWNLKHEFFRSTVSGGDTDWCAGVVAMEVTDQGIVQQGCLEIQRSQVARDVLWLVMKISGVVFQREDRESPREIITHQDHGIRKSPKAKPKIKEMLRNPNEITG